MGSYENLEHSCGIVLDMRSTTDTVEQTPGPDRDMTLLNDALTQHPDHDEEICALGHYSQAWYERKSIEAILKYLQYQWDGVDHGESQQGQCSFHTEEMNQRLRNILTLQGDHRDEICDLVHFTKSSPEFFEPILNYLQYQWGLEAEYNWMMLRGICPRPHRPISLLGIFERVYATDGYAKPWTTAQEKVICSLLKQVSMNPRTHVSVVGALQALGGQLDEHMDIVDGKRKVWQYTCPQRLAKWREPTKQLLSEYDELLNMKLPPYDAEVVFACQAFAALDDYFISRVEDYKRLVPLYNIAYDSELDPDISIALMKTQSKIFESAVAQLMDELTNKAKRRQNRILANVAAHVHA